MEWQNLMTKGVVYALINEEGKRFYLGQTTNLASGLYHLSVHLETTKYALMKEDAKKLKLHILETNMEDVRLRKHKLYEYRNDYLDKGYTEYVTPAYQKFRIKIEIGEHYKDSATYYFVNMYDSRNTRIILGVFQSEEEAISFYNSHYPNGSISGLVFANNPLTVHIRKFYNQLD